MEIYKAIRGIETADRENISSLFLNTRGVLTELVSEQKMYCV